MTLTDLEYSLEQNKTKQCLLPYNPAMPALGAHPGNVRAGTPRENCALVFTAAYSQQLELPRLWLVTKQHVVYPYKTISPLSKGMEF